MNRAAHRHRWRQVCRISGAWVRAGLGEERSDVERYPESALFPERGVGDGPDMAAAMIPYA